MALHPALFEFLKAIREQNSRKYFASIRPLYDDILANIHQFINQLCQELAKYNSDFKEIDPKKAMFRIYRDARRLREWDYLYKYNRWMVLNPDGKRDPKAYPYLHFSPDKSRFSGGIFWGKTPILNKVRHYIVQHADEYFRITEDPNFLKTFGPVYGERLKTVPRWFNKEIPHLDLIRHKQRVVSRQYTDKEVLSDGFIQQVVNDYLHAKPFFDFINKALNTKL